MRTRASLALLVAFMGSLSGCVSIVDVVDRDLSLPDAKAHTQSIEREIVEAMPSELVYSVEQKETGTFLACSRGGGEQWAGGLTAKARPGVLPDELLGNIEEQFSEKADMSVSRRVEDEDSLVDIAGPHSSFWIVRYDPVQAEIRIVSFSPCIYLPEDVWRGDKY
ncbi:hypothetical protein [Microbacterium sp. VKM Ac-2923]|uniref:hypothetical protein n=1 Tax=Microbacterium sp. VKM Ac-2923 TaxID=2929476 RepID=UPI001FB44C07|nr:hypothetical protein [Microbacterium sp. VKM Ac-2923]MCJ1706891.1 hypothetical protein [Microbacterium sp. VKM Ac-2923]